MLRNLKTERLNVATQEQIKFYIIESGLKAGDPLPTEKALEQQLGISRTSIREALRSLEAIGIVESRHGVGRFLRTFNYDAILENLSYNINVNVKNFREIIDVRMALESSFLPRVVPKFEEQDIDRIYRILERMAEVVDAGQEEQQLIQIHTEFHLMLYERENNELLLHLIRIFATMQRTLTVAQRYRTSDLTEFIELHRRLVEAIERRDPGLAVERLVEHFKDVVAWAHDHQRGLERR
jgi:GntR family transcriptional repressor for pyruvate dehydrogenase complex